MARDFWITHFIEKILAYNMILYLNSAFIYLQPFSICSSAKNTLVTQSTLLQRDAGKEWNERVRGTADRPSVIRRVMKITLYSLALPVKVD